MIALTTQTLESVVIVSVFGVSFSKKIPSEYDIGHVEFEKTTIENVGHFAPITGA